MGHKKLLRHKIREVYGCIEEARVVLKDIASDPNAPDDAKDKCMRIHAALGLDSEELNRIKKALKL